MFFVTGTRRFGYERLFEFDSSFGWFCANGLVALLIATAAQSLLQRWLPPWIHVVGILLAMPVTLIGSDFLYQTVP